MMKKRVAAYIRVSTGTKAQGHSFEFQRDYWTKTLSEKPGVELIGIYADKAISGKLMSRRPQFMAMLQACKEGRIDMIYTKSVQRFARNTTELLTITRELRERGIGVFFERENINTLDTTSEMYLTIAAAIAEEDLNSYSSNLVWAYQDKFKKGEVELINGLYGYNTDENHRITSINEEEAQWVRLIYKLYTEDGLGFDLISKFLNKEGAPSRQNNLWKPEKVRHLIMNEKYCGDAYLQKTYSDGKTRKKNYGQRDMYYVKDNHPAIVTREVWEKAQEIRKAHRRNHNDYRGIGLPIYPFTGYIKCKCCGSSCQHRTLSYGNRDGYWKCKKSLEERKIACSNPGIKDKVIIEKFIEAFNEFVDTKQISVDAQPLQEKLNKLYEDDKELYQLSVFGILSEEDYERESKEIHDQIKQYEKRIQELNQIHINSKDLKKIEEFDENLVHRFIKNIYLENWTVGFEFYNGVVIERKYNNGNPGPERKENK